MEIFRCLYWSGPLTKLPFLKIELTSDAMPVKVRLQTYLADKRSFFSPFIKSLVRHRRAYIHQMVRWAFVSLFVPKPGAEYRLSSDLTPLNVFTIMYQFSMPNIKH